VRPNGLFAVHYVPLAAELWIDPKDGWLAVVDGETRYEMVERFRYDDRKPYPARPAVIFGLMALTSITSDGTTLWLFREAASGDLYGGDLTRRWYGSSLAILHFDTMVSDSRRCGFSGLTDAGVILKPLRLLRMLAGKIKLTGSFGVFWPGNSLRIFTTPTYADRVPVLSQVDPRNAILLQVTVADRAGAGEFRAFG